MTTMQEVDVRRELTGKVALVTGGARGLGAAICTTLAGAGATVVAADVRREMADELASGISASGGVCSALALDVTHAGSVERAMRDAAREFGGIDIIINNAGIDVTESIEDLTVEQWDRILAVNLRGPFMVARAAFPHMREAGGGSIVNIVSTAAKRAWANASAYHASKWGLLGFSHALHVEGRPHNIRVTAVIAGGMRTSFLFDRFPDLDPGVLQDPQNVADTVRFVLTQPPGTVIPEVMVLPMKESSWP